ncbi:lysine-specific permease [Paenibacillus sp. JCM 10914]|nr:lysine-specific permease [Paenibacillus sp. JCM 10914]
MDWLTIVATYVSVPLFLSIWFGYRLIKKSRIVPLHECDLTTRAR